jgi:hypothetical protein
MSSGFGDWKTADLAGALLAEVENGTAYAVYHAGNADGL